MSFLLSLACVIVGCLSASLTGASSLSDLYPPLWEECPGKFSDYSKTHGQYIIDPWKYTQRMGMYKILLTKTATYFQKFGEENVQNILWGLPLQHGWQYSTGRLADPTNVTNCGSAGNKLCISVDSWWADINYFLCALPFLAAVDSDIMGISDDQVTLLPPQKDQSLFCYNVSACRAAYPETMDKWNAFYELMKVPATSFDDLLKSLWAAHTSTLHHSLDTFEPRLDYYMQPEEDFERSWAVSLDYIATLLFPTTLNTTHAFQKPLPLRVLVTNDRAPFIPDLTPEQNFFLYVLNGLHKIDTATETASASSAWTLVTYEPVSHFNWIADFWRSQSDFQYKFSCSDRCIRKIGVMFCRTFLLLLSGASILTLAQAGECEVRRGEI
ncbi:protein LEG1 homolog [Rhynchocyon petersi]